MEAIKLSIANDFFSKLKIQNVRYCHWKSNQHLDAALAGLTDLDLLVSAEDRCQFEEVLKGCNFKEIISPFWKSYNGMEDWLGFDSVTGELLHLHLHYKLLTGNKYYKGYHLPVEEWLFTDLRIQEGVKVPAYEREILLLLIRIMLKTPLFKLNARFVLRNFIKGVILPGDFLKEFEWLLKRYEVDKFEDALADFPIPLNKKVIDYYFSYLPNKHPPWLFMIYSKFDLLFRLAPYRNLSYVSALFRFLFVRLNLVRFFMKKKTLKEGSCYLALVGADGAGKTRLATDLKKWLGWKLEVEHLYFGIPKEDFIIKLTIRRKGFLFERIARKAGLSIGDYIDALGWVFLANKRKGLSCRAEKMAAKGVVVIAERFPLRHFWGMKSPMDGPKLKQGKSRAINYLASIEKSLYKRIDLPDTLFLLKVRLEELLNRKSDSNYNAVREKSEYVNSITDERFTIIGEQDYENVLLDIKRHIWGSF